MKSSRLSVYLLFIMASLVGLSFNSPQARALYSTMDTGDLLEFGHYQAQVSSQFMTQHSSGMNLVGRFDTYFDDDANLRALIGFGETDFQLGAFVKWMPIPDFQRQPAMGLLMGLLYARDGDSDELGLRFHPLMSKNFSADFGDLTPFASLPFGLRSREGRIDFPLQLVVGSDVRPYQFDHISIRFELGFNLAEAFSYVSLGLVIQIDGAKGLQFTSL